jgi:hypothetical protein
MGVLMWSFVWLLAPAVGGLFLGNALGVAKHTLSDVRFLTRRRGTEKRHWGVAVCIVFGVWIAWCDSRCDADDVFGQLRGSRLIFAVNRGNVHKPWRDVLFGGRMSPRVYGRMCAELSGVIPPLRTTPGATHVLSEKEQ